MKISLALLMVLLCTGKVWAFDCDFFRDLNKTEVYVKYQVTNFRPCETHIYITSCTEDGYLVGMTNEGKTWIPVVNIVEVQQETNGSYYVHNHEQY